MNVDASPGENHPARLQKWAALACLLVALPLLCHFSFSWMGFTPTDEGSTLSNSRRLLDGQVPHRDYIAVRPPASPLLHVPEVAFGGEDTFWISRMVVWFQFAVIAAAWTFLLNRLLNRPLSLGAVCFATLICFAANAHTKHITAWSTIDGLFFLSVGIFLCTKSPSLAKLAGYFLIGISPLCKQNFAFAIPGTLLILGDWKRIPYWLAVALPGLVCLLILLLTGAWHDALIQFSVHTELLPTAVYHFFNAEVIGGAVLGFFSMKFLPPGKTSHSMAGLLIPFYLPLAAAAGILGAGKMAVHAFAFFGLLLGIAFHLLFHKETLREIKIVALLALLAAWDVSISNGYNNPALGSGILIAALIVLVFSMMRASGLRLPVRSLSVLSILIAAAFAYAKTEHIYRQPRASQLTYSLAGVLPGGAHLYTDRNTFQYMSDLKDAVAFVQSRHKQYAIIPDTPAYWVCSQQPNPYPTDWPYYTDINPPLLLARCTAAMEAHRKDTLVITQKVLADKLATGFVPLEANDYFKVVQYAHDHFHKVYENQCFVVYE